MARCVQPVSRLASSTATGWEGEFLFPAETFGLSAFSSETECRFDLVNNAKSQYLSALAYRGGVWRANRAYYPRLRFGAPGEARVGDLALGALEKDRIGVKAALANPGPGRWASKAGSPSPCRRTCPLRMSAF